MALSKDKRYCQKCKEVVSLSHFVIKTGSNGEPYYRCNIYEEEINSREKTKVCDFHGKTFPMNHFGVYTTKKGREIIVCKDVLLKNNGKLVDSTNSTKTLKNKAKDFLCKDGYKVGTEEYKRNSYLKSRFKINLEFYNSILESQDFCCAICGKHKSEFKKALHLDHDHITNNIRGILCSKCNKALGHFKDDLELLQKSFLYLISYGKEAL